MRVNENTVVSTARVLLVPYDSRHVPTYHQWMEDESVRAATASERLTLTEEYANQVEWRAAADKLTFIVCQPLGEDRVEADHVTVTAGRDDGPERMMGDANFFVYPDEDEDEGGGGERRDVYGEIDIMIAQTEHRGQGNGRAAVSALLHYILQPAHQEAILAEAAASISSSRPASQPLRLRRLVAKIQATNTASIGLFQSLGFEQRGAVNYFGEVELERLGHLEQARPEGYTEGMYVRV